MKQSLPMQLRAATFQPSTVDVEKRTATLVWTTGATVRRFDDWEGQSFLEELVTAGADLSRLNSGAPLLNSHQNNTLDDVLGVVERAWIEGSNGHAVVRFSDRAAVEPIFRDVSAGILRNISVGYSIDAIEVIRAANKGALDTIKVTRFTPMELSIVPIPADAGAQFRKGQDTFPFQLTEESPVNDELETRAEDSAAVVTQQEPVMDSARAAANARIREIGRHFNMSEAAEDAILLDSTVAEFQAEVRRIRSATANQVQVPSARRIEVAIPRRTRALRAFENSREGEEAAYRAGQWALATMFGNENAMRWCKDYGVRVMTGTTGTTSSVVPDEMVLPIINLREQYGVARRLCRVQPMSSDTATVPRRASGVTAYFPGRTTATTESDASFNDVTLVARVVAALTRISNAYADDAAIDLADFITEEMAYAFAVKEDDCLFNGTGASTYGGIYGILPKVIDGTHTQSAVDVATATHNLFTELDHDDLVTLRGRLPAFPGLNPVWVCSKYANAVVFDALKVAGGGNNIVDLGGRPAQTYLGDPIVISQSMPSGAATDYNNLGMLIYGDLRQGVLFGDRQGFEVQILRERYAEFRQIGVQCVERFDIVVHGLGDTTTAGPIVVLVGSSS